MIIIGIGASAGGLDALEAFFQAADVLEGSAFVVVQHLATGQVSLLPELLQRATGFAVSPVEDDTSPQANHVHVAPPGVEIRMRDGRFVLRPAGNSGHGLPIDAFFRSLADDRLEDAIGVILSGMGSDGTLGLRAMKERAAATFVQAPESARFDSMPLSAVRSGVADVVARPEEIPRKIAEFLRRVRTPQDPAAPVTDEEAIGSVLAILRTQTGHDFRMYKRNTVVRRIERRMALHQLASLADYASLLGASSAETELLLKELLIGVTSFFRDPQAWTDLESQALPDLLSSRPDGSTLRIWTPACSTGEEVYSLAMVLVEVIEKLCPPRKLAMKIFATDIDVDAIDKARAGRYPQNIRADVSPARLSRFFVQDDDGYVVRKDLREHVIFALQNVAMDPPFTRLDLIVCRNLLIYLDTSLQARLLPLFHHCLETGGLLMLGNAETTSSASDCFTPVLARSKIFRRIESGRRVGFVAFPATFDRQPQSAAAAGTAAADAVRNGEPRPDLKTMADQLLLQRYAPAAVLTNGDGDVLYISGRTGRYLEPAAGKANWNIFAMVREGLGQRLGAAYQEAVRERRSVAVRGTIGDPRSGQHTVQVTVDPIVSPPTMRGMVMVVFEARDDAAPTQAPQASKRTGARSSPLRRELASLHDALRTARDEAQNAKEQSQAAHEELQSTNEELQSTNEELTTSKEELQSINEELQTVNQELQVKVEELSKASDDMRNLLNSTEIATLFLDEELRVRRFTTQALKLFKLIPGDVGRPITDVTNDLQGWAIAEDARQVLESLAVSEREVAASADRWFKVRTMPYRTSRNLIDGVVITFFDVTQAKRLELELLAAKKGLQVRLDERPIGAAKEPHKEVPAGKPRHRSG